VLKLARFNSEQLAHGGFDDPHAARWAEEHASIVDANLDRTT
jgi:hypothetical protein